MDCYVNTCTVGPLFFDFNGAQGFVLLALILGAFGTVGGYALRKLDIRDIRNQFGSNRD